MSRLKYIQEKLKLEKYDRILPTVTLNNDFILIFFSVIHATAQFVIGSVKVDFLCVERQSSVVNLDFG